MFKWFKIFNATEFDALDLISKTYTVNLEGIGQRDILVTKGTNYGLTYEGIFLSVQMNEQNPFKFDGHAVYIDDANDVWLGTPI